MLIKNEIKYFGNDRFDALATQLQHSFKTPTLKFSSNHFERYLQLEKIYDENVTNSFRHLWENFTEEFQIIDVAKHITQLNTKKDAGTMGITAAYIKFNKERLIPIFHHYFSKILEYGIIPDEWKKLHRPNT